MAYEVWPENWKVVQMFLKVQTQWNIGGMGTVVGLNYQSVGLMFEINKTKNRRKIMSGLQVIESAVLRVLAERQAKK